jgi:hypothetical protein
MACADMIAELRTIPSTTAKRTDVELSELRHFVDELGRELHRHLHTDLITYEQCPHQRCRRAREWCGRLEVR